MNICGATVAGDRGANRDWHHTDPRLVVLLDGVTVTTSGTGCVHGVPWYVAQLGLTLVQLLARPRPDLPAALGQAIAKVSALHPQCDLAHPGTPSAGVAVVLEQGRSLKWLVLGEVTLAVDTGRGIEIVLDDRVCRTAAAARATADLYPLASELKNAALARMRRAEHAGRNIPGGYWIAAADPRAATHARQGTITRWDQAAVLTDGAARVHSYGLLDWAAVFKLLAATGPSGLLRTVRDAERQGPDGTRGARNTRSEDATVAFLTPTRDLAPPPRGSGRSG